MSEIRKFVFDVLLWTAVPVGATVILYLLGRELFTPHGVGQPAPDFTIEDLDGRDFALAEQRGRPVVVNFFAQWCGACRDELPELARFAREHPEVSVISLTPDGRPYAGAVERVTDEAGVRYPVAVGAGAVHRDYAVASIPTTVVIDPDGTVLARHVGWTSASSLEASLP